MESRNPNHSNPDPAGLTLALAELDYLAALDHDGNPSETGLVMSELPVEPQMAKALLASRVSEVAAVAASTSTQQDPGDFRKYRLHGS